MMACVAGSKSIRRIQGSLRNSRRALYDSAIRTANARSRRNFLIRLPYAPSALSEPRYGYGRPPHPRLAALLGNHDEDYKDVLTGFGAYTEDLRQIELESVDPGEPHWLNGQMFGLDGVSLYGFTRDRAPRRYLEVGSGNSTLFVEGRAVMAP
jgi:hypothetical protein